MLLHFLIFTVLLTHSHLAQGYSRWGVVTLLAILHNFTEVQQQQQQQQQQTK